jgi:hypothetical protein
MARDEDEGELKDFMRRLERPAVPAPEPGKADVAPPPPPVSIARVLGLEAPPPAPAAVEPAAGPEPTRLEPERPRSDALDRFGSHLGGVLGLDDGAAPSPASVAWRLPRGASGPPGGGDTAAGVVALVPFAPGGSRLPAGAEAELGRALAEARRAGAGLRIAAGGRDGALRAGRARAVAAALVRLGAEAGALELAGGEGGAGEGEVWVSLVGRS